MGISSRLLFLVPSHFLSTIPIPIPMNLLYASHSRGTNGNSRIMHTSSFYMRQQLLKNKTAPCAQQAILTSTAATP